MRRVSFGTYLVGLQFFCSPIKKSIEIKKIIGILFMFDVLGIFQRDWNINPPIYLKDINIQMRMKFVIHFLIIIQFHLMI